MAQPERERFAILEENDIVRARLATRQWTTNLNFNPIEQTKMITAVSELARNTLIYGGGGSMTLEIVEKNFRRGLRAVFEDNGPGIIDIEQAMKNGFTTGHGLGLGLGGAQRLCNEFELISKPGQGTRVTILRWK